MITKPETWGERIIDLTEEWGKVGIPDRHRLAALSTVIGGLILALSACSSGPKLASVRSTTAPNTTAITVTTVATTTTTTPPSPVLQQWLQTERQQMATALLAYSQQDNVQPVDDAATALINALPTEPWPPQMTGAVDDLKTALTTLAAELGDTTLSADVDALNNANAEIANFLNIQASELTTPTTVPPIITLRVTGTGSRANSITFLINGQETQHTDVALPWSTAIPYDNQQILGVTAQTDDSSATASISCSITITGEKPITNTSTGPYSVVDCTGS